MSIFADASTWVSIFFFTFVALLIWKKVPDLIGDALDKRSADIQKELDEARKLREEAQELLASYKRQQQEAEQEAAKILQRAKEEAARLEAKSKTDLENSIQRREAAAEATHAGSRSRCHTRRSPAGSCSW